MFPQKIRFMLLFPLMALGGTDGHPPELESVTNRYVALEEPFWDAPHNRLLFAAQVAKQFCAYYPESEETKCTEALDGRTSTIVPVAETEHEFAVGIGNYFGKLTWDGHSHHSKFKSLTNAQEDGCGEQIFTEGEADKYGRFWIGTTAQNEEGEVIENEGNVYQYKKDKCGLKLALERVTVTNGLTWDQSYTKMFLTGCDDYRIDKYNYDKATGEISHKQKFLDFKERNIEGQPRGLTTDSDGNIWIACYGGWQIIKVDPHTAEILETVKLPVSQPTAMTFGGHHLDVIYVLTSREGLSAEEEHHQPKAGTVLQITGLKERGTRGNEAVLCHNDHEYEHHSKYDEDEDDCYEDSEEEYGNRPLTCCYFMFFLFPLMTFCAGQFGDDGVEIQSVTPRLFHLEEPHFDFQRQILFFADQYGKKFCSFDLKSSKTSCIPQDLFTGMILPIAGLKNQFVAGIGPYFGILTWDGVSPQFHFRILQSVQDGECSYQIFNDGKADTYGRVWIGTEGQDSNQTFLKYQGNLYSYETSTCNLEKNVERNYDTNAVVWNINFTKMYFVGCEQYRMDIFDYEIGTGKISNRQPFIDFQARNISGVPQGSTIDIYGNLWIACYDGHQIIQVDPITAKILRIVKVPVARVTDLMWGGPNLDILFATTSRRGMSKEDQAEQPFAGTVLAIIGLQTKGFPANKAVICQQVKQVKPVCQPSNANSCCAKSTAKPQAVSVISCCQ